MGTRMEIFGKVEVLQMNSHVITSLSHGVQDLSAISGRQLFLQRPGSWLIPTSSSSDSQYTSAFTNTIAQHVHLYIVSNRLRNCRGAAFPFWN